jgi:hypothetical protein
VEGLLWMNLHGEGWFGWCESGCDHCVCVCLFFFFFFFLRQRICKKLCNRKEVPKRNFGS